jgi:hypothetical protein
MLLPVLILTSALFLSSCHNGQSKKDVNADSTAKQKSSDAVLHEQLTIGKTKLNVLYTTSEKLWALMIPDSNGKIEKLVFQFISDSIGNISLAGFPGWKVQDQTNKKTTFDISNPLLLTASSTPADPDCDIAGKNVLFSNEEINKKNDYMGGANDIRTLYQFMKTHQRGFYITFNPSLLVLNNTTIYKINYQIGYTRDLPQGSHPFVSTPIPNLSSPNPTPPRNSY